MSLIVHLIVTLWFVSAKAQFFPSGREFAVENCSACLKIDPARPNITMASCNEGEGKCVCKIIGNGIYGKIYFPKVVGNATQCALAWGTDPGLYTAFVIVPTLALLLYPAAHLFYIVWLSQMCCCARRGGCAWTP